VLFLAQKEAWGQQGKIHSHGPRTRKEEVCLYLTGCVRYTFKKYTFKSLGSLRNVLVLKRGIFFCPLKYQIDQKYRIDIVNVVNDYFSWKQQIFLLNIYTGVQRSIVSNNPSCLPMARCIS
jgi:hypothetical protein